MMARRTDRALVSDQAGSRLDPAGFDPSRVTQPDRQWCTEFDRSSGFLEGRWDDGVTMRRVVAHRMAVETDVARRIFDEVHADAGIETDAAIKVYAAIKRALSSLPLRDSDEHPKGEDAERLSGEAKPARAEGIAQNGGDHA